MKKILVLLIFFDSVQSLAKPYECSFIRFGPHKTKILETFAFDPNERTSHQIEVKEPDSAGLACHGIELNNKTIRLVCAIGEPSSIKVWTTVSTREGAEIMTLVTPVGKNYYAVACVGKWTALSSRSEALGLSELVRP